MIQNLEHLMYQISDLFMAPVLILLVALFFYSLYALGGFLTQAIQRRKGAAAFRAMLGQGLDREGARAPRGYPLAAIALMNPKASKDDLDVAALGEMEGVRLVSRIAPMLGLIATIIPMGPALKSLSDGDVQGISENLIIAFSAVIFGLVVASITFFVASIKRKWLAQELVALAPLLDRRARTVSAEKELNREAA